MRQFSQIKIQQNFNLLKGHNKIQLFRPLWVKKGQMIYAYTTIPHLLGINITEEPFYSDYELSGCFGNFTINSNWRFLLNALVDKTFYKSVFLVSKSFEIFRNKLSNQVFYENSSLTAFFNENISQVVKYFNVSTYRNDSKNFFFYASLNSILI